MPNWCYTKYRFRGCHEELVVLKDKLEKWTSRNYYENDYGVSWLGNILIGCMIDTGLCTEENAAAEYDRREKSYREATDKRWNAIRSGLNPAFEPDPEWLPNHRGSINSDIDFNGMCELELDTETAWGEMPEVFEWVVERLGLGVSCWYLAEEPNNGHYQTNDIMGLVFGEEYDFYVDYLLEGEDAGEGESEEFFSESVNKQSFLNICRSMLEEPIQDDVSEDELDNLASKMNSKKWKSEYSYCSVIRLQRRN